MSKLTLERAKEILPKHTSEDHLFVHAACVSAAMGAMAEYFGEDEDHWEAIGWLHDVDYEQYPSTEEHCHHVREFLEPEGVDEEDIRSIISHGYGITTDEVEPTTNLEKSLFTVDELTGIVHAYALMRPENMDGMAVKSFKKKFTVNKTTGNVTVKKGLKKGTYKVKIKVTAAGNDNYKEAIKPVTVTIKVE